MKNLEYLECFFKKHNLKGNAKIKYTNYVDDDNISEVTLDNGITMSIDDIRFDIDSLLDSDVGKTWMDVHKESGIGFREWMETDNHYMPKNIDTSSIDEYHKEMENIVNGLKETVDKIFILDDENKKRG